MNEFKIRNENSLARRVEERELYLFSSPEPKDGGGKKEDRPHPGPLPQERVTRLPRRSRIERWDRTRGVHGLGRVPGESPLLGGEDLGENSPKESRIEPLNHPGQDITKTLRAFLPLRVGGVCGADGERAGVRCSFHHLWVPGEGGLNIQHSTFNAQHRRGGGELEVQCSFNVRRCWLLINEKEAM